MATEYTESKNIEQLTSNEIIRLIPEINHWQQHNSNEIYQLIKLDSLSTEYQNIANKFFISVRSYKITSISRVQNPYLYAQYWFKHQHMKNNEYNIDIKKTLLFHGTRSIYITDICKNNFNWRLNGRSRGHKFGQGVSFARDAYYATHYGNNEMFCAEVLIGKSSLGGLSTIIPPNNLDTTQNVNGTVIVKYEDNDFYPSYLIEYL